MISLIEAHNYRCLRYIRQAIESFHVLVGPNASGKTTFLDTISFLGKLISEGLDEAISERSSFFQDLVWSRELDHFELALEAQIPEDKKDHISRGSFDAIRYEISIGLDETSNEIIIKAEKAVLLKSTNAFSLQLQRDLFPAKPISPDTIISPKHTKGAKTVLNKVSGGNDNFYSEVHQGKGKGWAPSFRLGPRKSTLGNLPEDDLKFPITTWLKGLLSNGIQELVLNSRLIRKASPPGQIKGFKPDGSNIPWIVFRLANNHPETYRDWISHLQTALPDLQDIKTIERQDDKHRYLVLCYRGGMEVPSWMVSDGTLRLLALTLPAYYPEFSGIYLIEEPENGIHPRAVETMYQSLSSIYNAQILMATHSPVILSMAESHAVLCFAKTNEGETDIVAGSEHPALSDWKKEVDLGELFAGGVLG